MACDMCSLLAASKDYIGTHCLACGALLPGDKFEEEIRAVIKSHYAGDDKDKETALHDKLAVHRYAGMKFYRIYIHSSGCSGYRVHTRKMLNDVYPGLHEYDIDALFTVNVTKNIYTTCDKSCYCDNHPLYPTVHPCNAFMFATIVRKCIYNIEKYRVPAVAPVDPYPELTKLLMLVDVYGGGDNLGLNNMKIPRKYDDVELYIVCMSHTRPYVNLPNKKFGDKDLPYQTNMVVVTIEYLHYTYPELAKYDHKKVFIEHKATGVHTLRCPSGGSLIHSSGCGCSNSKCPSKAYQRLLSQLEKKKYYNDILSAIEKK